MLKTWLYFSSLHVLFKLKEYLYIILVFSCSTVFPFFSTQTCSFFLEQRWKLVRCSYKHRHFENTKLLAENDYVIDIFTGHKNILLCTFSILVSTI